MEAYASAGGRSSHMPKLKGDRLLQETRDPHVDRSARRTGRDSALPRRVAVRILHEPSTALPPTIFFFVGFNFIVLTTNLLVADYGAAVGSFMLATVALRTANSSRSSSASRWRRNRGPRQAMLHGRLESISA